MPSTAKDKRPLGTHDWSDLLVDGAEPAAVYFVWTQRGGDDIPLRYMSDGHLRNTLLMLRRKGFDSSTLREIPSLIYEYNQRLKGIWKAPKVRKEDPKPEPPPLVAPRVFLPEDD